MGARGVMGQARMPAHEGERVRWTPEGDADADTCNGVAFLDADDPRWWWATGLLAWEEAATREGAIAAASARLRRLGYRVEGA